MSGPPILCGRLSSETPLAAMVAAGRVAGETEVIIAAPHRYAEDLARGARRRHRSLIRSALSPFELRQRPLRCGCQIGHAVRGCPPKDINVHRS